MVILILHKQYNIVTLLKIRLKLLPNDPCWSIIFSPHFLHHQIIEPLQFLPAIDSIIPPAKHFSLRPFTPPPFFERKFPKTTSAAREIFIAQPLCRITAFAFYSIVDAPNTVSYHLNQTKTTIPDDMDLATKYGNAVLNSALDAHWLHEESFAHTNLPPWTLRSSSSVDVFSFYLQTTHPLTLPPGRHSPESGWLYLWQWLPSEQTLIFWWWHVLPTLHTYISVWPLHPPHTHTHTSQTPQSVMQVFWQPPLGIWFRISGYLCVAFLPLPDAMWASFILSPNLHLLRKCNRTRSRENAEPYQINTPNTNTHIQIPQGHIHKQEGRVVLGADVVGVYQKPYTQSL